MESKDNHHLSNAAAKENKLSKLRAEILSLDAEKALDAVLDSSFPASLIQSFSEQDLYFLMHHIGRDDFLPVLSLASSSQWEYILDLEVWNNDRLDIEKMTHNFELLYNADPQRFLRWTIKEKTEFIEYYLFKNMEIVIREHDQDPSDFQDALQQINNDNDFVTIDSIFYFRFHALQNRYDSHQTDTNNTHKNEDNETEDNETEDDEIEEKKTKADSETLITNMLNTLADMDISVFHALLLETCTIIPSETEEEEFRLRNVRLAEKGFLPPHEAAAVYQPLKIKDLKKRPSIFFEKSFLDSDLPKPPLSPALMLQNNSLLYRNQYKSRDKTQEINKDGTLNKSETGVQKIESKIDNKNIFAASIEFLENLSHKKNKNSSGRIESSSGKIFDIILNFQSELAFLVNSIVSADKKSVRSKEELEKVVQKACSYLSLGMEIISSEVNNVKINDDKINNSIGLTTEKDGSIISGIGLTPQTGASIICGYTLKDIFRIGSGAVIKLKERAKRWYVESYISKNALSLNFLGEKWLGVIGGLFLDSPLFFNSLNNHDTDSYICNSYGYSSFSAYEPIYRPFGSSGDIKRTSYELDAVIEIDKIFEKLIVNNNIDVKFFSKQFAKELITWKPLFLTLWAMDRMNLDKSSGCFIPLNKFKPFFIQMLNLKSRREIVSDNENKKSDGYGTINYIVRDDFFNWLNESSVFLSDTARIIFEALFDELEQEYGRVVQEDVDPKLIYHFIVK